jgi:hypothetical protein
MRFVRYAAGYTVWEKEMTNGNEEVGQIEVRNKIWQEHLQGMPPKHRTSVEMTRTSPTFHKALISRRKVIWISLPI